MKTRITELFGIRYPIIQGGMHLVGLAPLAAAVSNAGGLGVLTALSLPTPADLSREIEKTRKLTDKPIGVNLTFLPIVRKPDYPGYVKAIVDGGVKAVETAGNNPGQWVDMLKAAGVSVIHKCTTIRHALKAQSLGVDAISLDSWECAGHLGDDDIPHFIHLARAQETLKIPFVASGGINGGRGLVAALALGAEGVNMGTRFLATKEAPAHENVKQAILDAKETDTRIIMRAVRNTERVLRNAAVDRIVETEHRLGDAVRFEDIAAEVVAVFPRVIFNGEMDAGAWSCGMVVGLINDIPTCQELIDRMMAEARAIINKRLVGFAA